MIELALTAALSVPPTMTASWYGPGFHGRTTANGERYNQWALTAAHKTLPFGTQLKVSYKGKSVIVRINDRGPYIEGRSLDLSLAAFNRLAPLRAGVLSVKTELVFQKFSQLLLGRVAFGLLQGDFHEQAEAEPS